MSNGQWSAHRVLRDLGTRRLCIPARTSVQRRGSRSTDGDISDALDTQEGIIYGSQVWFDVTSYLEGVRTGSHRQWFGHSLEFDGRWLAIHLNGSADPELRPKLYVVSANLPIVSPALPGDFNGDGSSMPRTTAPGVTTWAAPTTSMAMAMKPVAAVVSWIRPTTTCGKPTMATWERAAKRSAAAVPESTSLCIGSVALLGMICIGRRRSASIR